MKLNGIFGTGSGKTGNAVFATSAGKQIVRTYQPKVSNPNTDAQVAQRAKFKLLSQLAAAMAPVIVIPKNGLVSARNRFVTKNIPLANYAENKASIEMVAIQLTDSNVSLPGLSLEGDNQQRTLTVEMESNVSGLFEKIRYVVFMKTEDAKLQLVAQALVSVNSTKADMAGHTFENLAPASYVVYAYGLNPKNASATVGYFDYDTEVDEQTADVETTLRISTYNYNFSVTKADQITLS